LTLVTGVTGYVGSAVVRRLLSQGLEVAAMVRDAGAAGERLPAQVTLRVADYEDISALRSALAGADQMILISSDSEARARHVAPCKHHVGGYSRQPPTHQLHEHR